MLFPDMRLISATGFCEGTIGISEKGESGFGYDSLFIPSALSEGKTMAELSSEDEAYH
ncbi:hypothetical protein KAH37_05520 [bacterium]|nr:hypothetical protein [bacterium]